jgi:hypothetical protein
MLCVDHGNGQVQASLKSDRGSGAQAPPRASPIAARDRATARFGQEHGRLFQPISRWLEDVLGRAGSLRADSNR